MVPAQASPPQKYNFNARNAFNEALELNYDSRKPNHDEMICLARAIYHEARGEPRLGKIAVAFVFINRTKSGRYPSTICGVVYQRGQSSWVGKKHHEREHKAWQDAKQLATYVLLSYNFIYDPTLGSTFFDTGLPKAHNIKPVKKIGHHVFYRKVGDPIFNMRNVW